MEFNVGDVVRIRQDLNLETMYNDLIVITPMMEMCRENKEWVISRKYKVHGYDRYILEGQTPYGDGEFIWSTDMLEPVDNIVISQSELADFLGI